MGKNWGCSEEKKEKKRKEKGIVPPSVTVNSVNLFPINGNKTNLSFIITV